MNADSDDEKEEEAGEKNGQQKEKQKADNEEEKSEDSDSYDSYDPDDFDENGNYIWGKEGEDWEFYYDEDRVAFENGESTVSNVLNPDMLPQKGTAVGEYYSKSTAVTADGQVIRASYAKDGAFYVTKKKGKTTEGSKPVLLTE